MDRADQAVELALQGMNIVPVPCNTEVALFGWNNLATNNPETILEWLEDGSNYGVIPGAGFVVIEVKKEKDGFAVLEELLGTKLPLTFTVCTVDGGEHRYYSATGLQSSKRLCDKGLELFAEGSCLLGPKSTLNGVCYEGNGLPIARLNREQIDLLKDAFSIDRNEGSGVKCFDDADYCKTLNCAVEESPLRRESAIALESALVKDWLPGFPEEGLAIAESVALSAIGFIEKNGQRIQEDHKQALGFVSKALVSQIYPDEAPKRLAIPVFTGAGKTVCVAAFAAELQRRTNRGCLIAISTIELMTELKNLIVQFGVDRTKIALRHSKAGGLITEAEAAQSPIVIVTHERFLMDDWINFQSYKGEERAFVWDEAMLSTEAKQCRIEALTNEIGEWKKRYDILALQGSATELQTFTARYFEDVYSAVTNAKPRTEFQFPKKELPLDLGLYSSDLLKELDQPHEELSIVDHEKNVYWWRKKVPDGLNRGVILDATASVRKLEQYDPLIQVVSIPKLKTYESLEIKWIKSPVGRSSVRGELYRPLCMDLAARANSLPTDSSLLVFQRKDKPEEQPLQEGLTLANKGEDLVKSGRIKLVSWGQSKGTNELRRFTYGTNFGMVCRDHDELAMSIAGQRRDRNWTVTLTEVLEVQLSEHVSEIVQAVNRMACRDTFEGKAATRCTFWLYYPSEAIVDELKKELPGVRITACESAYLTGKPSVLGMVGKILEALNRVPKEPYSLKRLYKETGLFVDTSTDQWRKARRQFLDGLNGWKWMGRTFVPITYQ